jgi:hypothetical protein
VQSDATEFKVESFTDVVKAVHDATGEYLAIDAMIAQATERHSGLQDLFDEEFKKGSSKKEAPLINLCLEFALSSIDEKET